MQRDVRASATRDAAAGEWVAIIDDHDSLRTSIARALRLEGIRVQSFASAEAFLDRETESSPVCLVLDMQLPAMNGHELMHFLQSERPPLPPTILISGHEDMLKTVGECCTPHGRLRKPFEVEALLSLLLPLLTINPAPD